MPQLLAQSGGLILGNCDGALLPRIKRGDNEIFSVRTAPRMNRLSTIEYDHKSKLIRQVKGRNNHLLTAETALHRNSGAGV